jgi:mRNA interferase MazF
MGLLNKFLNTKNITQDEKEFEKKKKELAYAIQLAVGKRTTAEFIALCKLTDPQPILSIRKMEYKEFPDRELLRRIASNSLGRVSWQHLYDLCGYSEFDSEEDRTWAKWVPQWGNVYMCDLGIGEDNIQGGKRPVVVIQNDKGNQHSPNVSILPISTKNKFSNSSLHIFLEKEIGFLRDSWACAEMPMTITKEDSSIIQFLLKLQHYRKIKWNK